MPNENCMPTSLNFLKAGVKWNEEEVNKILIFLSLKSGTKEFCDVIPAIITNKEKKGIIAQAYVWN